MTATLSAAITAGLMSSIAAEVIGTYKDIDGAAGDQCWDSVNYINMHYFGLPRIDTYGGGKAGRWPGWAGNMVDCFPQNDAVAAAYDLLPPGTPGLPGDTYVWGDSNQLWYPKTHTATLLWDLGNGWGQFLSQNSSAAQPWLSGYSDESTGPIIEQTLPLAGLIGIIRPRISGGLGYASTSQEGTMTTVDLTQGSLVQVQGFTNAVIDQVWATGAGTQKLIQDLFGELNKKMDDKDYQMRVFNQASDNYTGDRIIKEFRAQIAAVAASVAAASAAQGLPAADIQKQIESALEGATFSFTGTATADPAAAPAVPAQ